MTLHIGWLIIESNDDSIIKDWGIDEIKVLLEKYRYMYYTDLPEGHIEVWERLYIQSVFNVIDLQYQPDPITIEDIPETVFYYDPDLDILEAEIRGQWLSFHEFSPHKDKETHFKNVMELLEREPSNLVIELQFRV